MTRLVDVLLRAVGPRRLRTARPILAGVHLAAAVTVLVVVLVRPDGPTWAEAGTIVVLAVLALALVRLPDAPASALCALTHVMTIALLLALDLATRDATVAGQVFFYLPVLSAGTLLRVPGVVVVTVLAVAGEAVLVLTVLPTDQALTDLAFVGATLVTTAVALGRAGVLQDRLVAELERQAAVDPLTGLLTRRVLDRATAVAVVAAHEPRRAGTSLLLVDVDEFKQVNDRYGHVAGDAALSHIAGLLRAGGTDSEVAARMGGDEMALLLTGCRYEQALQRAQQVVDATRAAPLRLDDGRSVALSVSIGVASVPDHASSAAELYREADAALYEAKRGGRGRVGRVPPVDAVPLQAG